MKIAFVAATVVAILSIVANVFQTRALMGAFADLHLSRVFPLGFVTPERAFEGNTVSDAEAIAIYGDSRASLWNTEALQSHIRIVNLAHGAQTSSQLLLQLESTPIVRTKYALLQIGINDLHPLGALEKQKDQALQNLKSNLQAIVTQLTERSQIVVISTIIPPGRVPLQRRLVWDPMTEEYVEATNRALRNLANGERVVLLDAAALLSDKRGKLRQEYVDRDFFLHLNPAAYDVLNAALLDDIKLH